MVEWHDYDSSGSANTVVGNIKVLDGLRSNRLRKQRHTLVYLPPSYEQGQQHYPVIYMHDGQNLFDAATSFVGEWQVDNTMEALSEEGIEAIIVGVPNAEERRLDEYSPFPHPRHGGGHGEQYLSYIVKVLKPVIDRELRTCPERTHTGIMGSSMGGLISLYAFFHFPKVFGLVGAMSPSLWFTRGAIYDYIQHAPFTPGKIYLDAGTREYGDDGFVGSPARKYSRSYYAGIRRMQRVLYKKGYRPRKDLYYFEEKGARHEEGAWARRLPIAFRFLLTANYEGTGRSGG